MPRREAARDSTLAVGARKDGATLTVDLPILRNGHELVTLVMDEPVKVNCHGAATSNHREV
jgi:hypothetical protein